MKINIGCGWRDFGKEWIHIDGGDYDHIDSNDILIREFKKESVELIYSSHLIEYFDREEVIPIIKRWRKVLKPNIKRRKKTHCVTIFSINYNW